MSSTGHSLQLLRVWKLWHPAVRLPALHLLRMPWRPHHQPPAGEEAQRGPGALPRNALLLRLSGLHLRCEEQGVCTNQPEAGGQGSAEESGVAAMDPHSQGDESAVGQCAPEVGATESDNRTEGAAQSGGHLFHELHCPGMSRLRDTRTEQKCLNLNC